MSNCKPLTTRREKCHALYGKLGEDCLIEELEEKRCVSFRHCAREAQAYYGSLHGKKALCASWAESFAFENPLLEEETQDHHNKASQIVNSDKNVKRECRAITLELVKCMRKIYY